MPGVDVNKIPQELKDVPQWVDWKWARRPGEDKPTKPPLGADGSRAR